jgi:hypothetical protein
LGPVPGMARSVCGGTHRAADVSPPRVQQISRRACGVVIRTRVSVNIRGPGLKSEQPAEPSCRPRAVLRPLTSADRYHAVPMNPARRWISRSVTDPRELDAIYPPNCFWRRCGVVRSVEGVRWAGSRSACRPVAWLDNDVPACRALAVAWLERGATADRSGIRPARHGSPAGARVERGSRWRQ